MTSTSQSDPFREDWWLKHPVLTVLIIVGITAAVGLLGVAAAYVTSAAHLVSPDNVLAGAGMGGGGALLGGAAGIAFMVWLNARKAAAQ